MKLKWTIFSNAFLCGADFVLMVFNFCEGKYWMGTLFAVLAGGLGWLSWNADK